MNISVTPTYLILSTSFVNAPFISGLDKRRGGISIFDNTKTRFKNLALVQSNFLQNRKNRPKTAEIDVIQWDKYWKKENNSDSESNSNNIDELGDNLDESDEDLEIVSIRPTFVQKLDDALKRSSESQTDPVQVRISEVLGC